MVGKTAVMVVVALAIYGGTLWVADSLHPDKKLHHQYLQVYEKWEQAVQRNPELPPPEPPPMSSSFLLAPLLAAAVAFGFWGTMRSRIHRKHWIAGGWIVGIILQIASLVGQLAGGADVWNLIVHQVLLAFTCIGGLYASILATSLSEQGWVVRSRQG